MYRCIHCGIMYEFEYNFLHKCIICKKGTLKKLIRDIVYSEDVGEEISAPVLYLIHKDVWNYIQTHGRKKTILKLKWTNKEDYRKIWDDTINEKPKIEGPIKANSPQSQNIPEVSPKHKVEYPKTIREEIIHYERMSEKQKLEHRIIRKLFNRPSIDELKDKLKRERKEKAELEHKQFISHIKSIVLIIIILFFLLSALSPLFFGAPDASDPREDFRNEERYDPGY